MGFFSIVGDYLGGSSQRDADRATATELQQLGDQAWDRGQFRPVGITTRFGSSNYTIDPKTGKVTSAGYEASPEVKAQQDRLFDQGNQGLDFSQRGINTGNQLFDLGSQYLAKSPEEAAADWMNKQQDLLAPSREKALSGVRQGLFNTGRGGLGIAQGGDLAATNPEMAAYYNALAQQDMGLAADAMEQGRAQVQFGTGLFGSGIDIAAGGYKPYAASLSLNQSLEEAAQQPFNMGINLGKTTSNINQGAQRLVMDPYMDATKYTNQANSWNPWSDALSGFDKGFDFFSFF